MSIVFTNLYRLKIIASRIEYSHNIIPLYFHSYNGTITNYNPISCIGKIIKISFENNV